MAREVADGDFSVFYWGQQYGGTITQLIAGSLFALTEPSFFVLQIVEVSFWVISCLLLRSIVAKSCGVFAGNVSGALFWFASPLMAVFTTLTMGFYGAGLALGLCSILIAQHVDRYSERLTAAAIGLCLGLAFWTTALALAIVVPAVLWVVARLRSGSALLIGSAFAAVGAAPWLWANARTGLASLERQQGGQGDLVNGYWRVFTEPVPAFTGQLSGSPEAWATTALFLTAPLAGVAFGFWRRNIGISAVCSSALLVPLVVAFSGAPVVPAAWRYATLMVPAVAAALGCVLSRYRPLAALAVAAVVMWTAGTLWNATNGLDPVPNPTFGSQIEQLGTRLHREGRTAVWADYWISYLLSASTDERVTAAAIGVRREPSYEVAASRRLETTVVLFAGGVNDRILERTPGLPSHRRALVGPYAIWVFANRLDVPQYLSAVAVP